VGWRDDVAQVAFAVLRQDARTHRRQLAAECRIADVQVPCRDLGAKCFQYHQAHRDPDSRPACGLVVDHVLALAAKDGKQAPSSLPVLQPGWLSRQGVEVVRRVCLGLVQMVKATGLLVQEALP